MPRVAASAGPVLGIFVVDLCKEEEEEEAEDEEERDCCVDRSVAAFVVKMPSACKTQNKRME
jgi:hypothetical protein